MAQVFAWLEDYRALFFWLGMLSLGSLLVSALVIPWVIVHLPADYFTRAHRPRRARGGRWWVALGKNLLGAAFVLAGIAMLVLPGQGLLSILMGVMLLEFPRKYELERRLVGLKAVHVALDWIRRKAGKPPLRLGPEEV